MDKTTNNETHPDDQMWSIFDGINREGEKKDEYLSKFMMDHSWKWWEAF